MPSPFPGMDPYIERYVWEDFHHVMIGAVREALGASVRPRYVVRVERYVYVEEHPEAVDTVIRPDVAIADGTDKGAATGGAAVAIEPVVLTLPMPERMRHAYLTLRERETMRVVTVIEILSPANKLSASDGYREYLAKRQKVLASDTHLVELDLLRGGKRLPTLQQLPAGDYYAFVSRAEMRPGVEVYAWSLQRPLPPVPVPLAGDDADVVLDLQAIFTTAYDRAGYDYSLDYRGTVQPPLNDDDRKWAAQILAGDTG